MYLKERHSLFDLPQQNLKMGVGFFVDGRGFRIYTYTEGFDGVAVSGGASVVD